MYDKVKLYAPDVTELGSPYSLSGRGDDGCKLLNVHKQDLPIVMLCDLYQHSFGL